MMKRVLNYVCLVAVLLLAACSEKNEYTRVIPQNASLVGSVQLTSLVEKSGLTSKENQAVLDKLKKNVLQGLPAEQSEQMGSILSDPQESGIDFKKPVYFFVMPDQKTTGAVLCVKSSSKLHELVETLAEHNICSSVEEMDGASWVESGKNVVAFTDEVLLLVSGAMPAEDLKKQVVTWLGASSDKSYAGTDEFKDMENQKGDVSFISNMDMFPADLRGMMQMGMPEGAKLDDIKLLTAIHFEKGKVVADVQTIYKNAELKKMAEEKMAVLNKLNTKFMDNYPENTFLWMAMNGNGSKLYEQMNQQKVLAQMLSGFDLKPLFEAVDGMLTFGVSSIADNSMPQISLFAEVKNADFLPGLVENLKTALPIGRSMRLEQVGKEQYELQLADGSRYGMGAGPVSICIGVRDKQFYLTNDKLSLNEGVKGKNLTKSVWADEVSGKRFFMVMNMEGARDIILSQTPRSNRAMVSLFIENFGYMTLDVKDAEHATLVSATGNDQTNVLKQWVDMALKMAGMAR